MPRQIANAATIWATANTLILLPFASWFARLATRIVPDRAPRQMELVTPRCLDDEPVQVPAMALERARMELGHMAERTDAMLAKVPSAFESGDARELSRQADEVLVLREAVLDYLAQVGRSELSDRDSEECVRTVAGTGDIESLSTAIGREPAPLARSVKDGGITPSPEAAQLIERLLRTIHEAAGSALRALVDGDERAAQSVLATRGAIVDLSAELHRWQATRLSPHDPDRLAKHRLQLEIVDRLQRIHGLAEHMALSVLPRRVLVGELAS